MESNYGTGGLSGQKYVIFPSSGGSGNYAGAGVSVGTNGVSVYEHADNYMPAVLVWQSPVPLTDWTHIAIVYTNGKPSLYINGVFKHTGVQSGKGTVYPGMHFPGGYTSAEGNLLDEMRIWKVTRTAAEIQADMNGEIPGSTPGLVGYWPMNEGSGGVLHDLSGNGRDISLNSSFNNSSWVAGRYSVESGNGYRYGFNGKELDQDINGEDYDYGMRIYDARLGRFLSVDPITRQYPELTPYQYASNNPIKFIDRDGEEALDPAIPKAILFRTVIEDNVFVTIDYLKKAAEIHGLKTDPYNRFLINIGNVFEIALLNAFDRPVREKDKQTIKPYPERPDRKFRPDNLRDFEVSTGTTKYVFQNAFLEDAKFTTGAEVKLEQTYNPEQIKGFIDYLANARGVLVNGIQTNEKIADYGAATLIITSPADVKISDEIIKYAKDRNVGVFKRVPIGITSVIFTESSDKNKDAMINNQIKFSEAFPVSTAENKKVNSDYYKAQQNGEAGGDNNESKKVKINWEKN